MKTIRRTKKEWLDNRGRILPTEQLKEVSKLWDEKTWEEYKANTEKESTAIAEALGGLGV